jgi:hypothetical protein
MSGGTINAPAAAEKNSRNAAGATAEPAADFSFLLISVFIMKQAG